MQRPTFTPAGKERAEKMRHVALRNALAAIIIVAAGINAAEAQIMYPDWSGQSEDPFPLTAPVANPVLTAADVTDTQASFLADPFIMFDNGVWYMFFEVYWWNPEDANIGLATSLDGYTWTYDRLVLQEEGIYAFPFVFRSNGDYYMTPNVSYAQDVKLYRADDFPYSWSQVATLVDGHIMKDPSILYYDETWWLFVGSQGSRDCYLYYSDSLATGWTEHPLSPVIADDPGKARPAGRFLHLANDRLIRLAMKCDEVYGEAVRAFEIDLLTRTEYAEHEIPESPVISAHGDGWASIGMHTCDAWWTGETWIAAVDGEGTGGWSIGIYESRPAAGHDQPVDLAGGGGLRLVVPNPAPAGADLRIRCSIPEAGAAAPLSLSIYDVSGRRLHRLSRPAAAGPAILRWDRRTAGDRPLAPGRYFVRADWNGRVEIRPFTIIR
jgi:hypothetical protein